MQKRNIVLALTSLALAAASFAASAADQVFSNTAPITIGGDPSSPYPSSIAVSGLSGDATSVQVTLQGLSHSFPRDIDVLLVAPGGQKILLMSDAGEGSDVSGINLTFSATASGALPSPLTSGTWLPTNVDDSGIGDGGTDLFPSTAPAGPYSTDLTTLNGPAAGQNGNWQLFVRDDFTSDDVGNFAGGWTLTLSGETLTGAPVTTCASEGYTGIKLDWCRNVCEKGYTGATLNAWIRRWWDKYHTYPYCAQ